MYSGKFFLHGGGGRAQNQFGYIFTAASVLHLQTYIKPTLESMHSVYTVLTVNNKYTHIKISLSKTLIQIFHQNKSEVYKSKSFLLRFIN